MVNHKRLRKLLAKKIDDYVYKSVVSDEYFEVLKKYDEELESLTEKIWETEYLNV